MKKLMLAAGALIALAAPAAQAETPAEFYKGKTLNVIVGYPPGGGYDIYARVIANYYGKHIPGVPSVIVKNRPGAASLVSVNELYSVNPKDGLTIATFARSVAMDRLLGRPSTNFEPSEINWIGSANNEISICTVWHTVGIKSVQDLLTKEIVFGANAAGSESDTYPMILRNLFGANVRTVTGYPGASDLMLAMERGETQGRCGYTWSAAQATRADWLREGKLTVALQFSVEKHPDMPNVPTVMELARTDKERAALELILAGQAMGRPFAAPPGVPADRVQALRRAFDATMKDPAFVAEADKQKLELQPVSGEKIQQLVQKMFTASPDVVESARAAIERPAN
ncbi:MAG TPA: tripartite tricarboxylate transporter substrate-binding protein [Alphaproteobacteria bacterium]|nr:tripartite tricarboxylate transporter substrate-binding protein [Alphaproteobacteria bacterium]